MELIERQSLQHQAISIVILLTLMCLVYLIFLIPAYEEYDEKQNELNELITTNAKIIDVGKKLAPLKKQFNDLKKVQIDKSSFLAASSNGLAVAELQKNIRRYTEKTGADLLSTTPLKTSEMDLSEMDLFAPITLRVNIKTSQGKLSEFIRLLETEKPLGELANIQITVANRNPFKKIIRNTRKSDNLNNLTMRFDYTSYVYIGKPK